MSNKVDSSDVLIIGGGLAGLTTAALVARSGKSVTLFERSSKEIGGRARSTEVDGFCFNQGPPLCFLKVSLFRNINEIILCIVVCDLHHALNIVVRLLAVVLPESVHSGCN